ncbi:hypothetical protein [Luteibacter pinisoli]|nr:hypothetical protein [Luteibacter pinisoli]
MNMRPLVPVALLALLCAPLPGHAAPYVECVMRFNLSSWAVLYKHASGHGTITCKDGSSMKVKITANGGGLALSKSEIKDGKANFTGLRTINDALGSYAAAEADSGIVKHGAGQVMTKGEVSVSLAGAGEGIGLGVAIGAFTLSRER